MAVVQPWTRWAPAAVALATAFVSVSGPVRAQEPTLLPPTLDCGPVSLGGAASFVSVNVGNSNRRMPSAGIRLRIVDEEGEELASRGVTLGAGQSKRLALRLPALTDGSSRMVRAEIIHVSGGPTNVSDFRLLGTMQVGSIDSLSIAVPVLCVPETLPRSPDVN